MKNLMTIFILTLFSTQAFSSGSDHMMDNGKKMKNGKMMGDTKSSKRKTVSKKVKMQLIKMLGDNESLHNSFYKYSGKKVEKHAKKVADSLSKVKDPEIVKLMAFAKTKLAEIKEKSPRESNNQNYHLFSMALIHVINSYDVGSKYNAYSCPMVKKKWVQNSKKMAKVHNPYAPNMPHCGAQKSHH
jgi:hypothetical protein